MLTECSTIASEPVPIVLPKLVTIAAIWRDSYLSDAPFFTVKIEPSGIVLRLAAQDLATYRRFAAELFRAKGLIYSRPEFGRLALWQAELQRLIACGEADPGGRYPR